ncbi:hypothetical protein B0H21DRAFT_699847, partial [Amylocystis lapponica]
MPTTPPPPADKTVATVVHTSTKHVPLLTPGKITPQVLHNWEHACRQYFKEKDIADVKKVAKVTGGLQDELMRDWYYNDSDTFDGMSWANFVSAMKARWLPKGWVDKTVTQLLRSRQTEDEAFEDWVISLEKLNTLLRGTTSHLDDVRLRAQISAAACEDIRHIADENVIKSVEAYRDWKDALIAADTKRLRDRARILRLVGSRPTKTYSSPSNTSTGVTSTGSKGTSPARLPKLTEDEKSLLRDHSGCFKCRRFQVKHTSATCTNPYPDAIGYRTLTLADANGIKPKTAVAAVIDGNVVEADFVAAVGPGSPLAQTSGILGSGSDSDDSEYVLAPLSVPHIPWSALINLPDFAYSDAMPMLIDSGSTTVLIRSAVVEQLGLRRWKLQQPKSMGNAWANKEEVATEFVKLRVSSPDFSWSSVTCQAIIVPSLCVPVLLGRPFLKSSHLRIDHFLDTVTDTRTGRNILDALPRTLNSISDGSSYAVCAVRARVEELAHLDVLRKHNLRMKEHFADMFPDDIPPLHNLPDDVYHRFVLKDPNMVLRRRQYDCPKKYLEAWK